MTRIARAAGALLGLGIVAFAPAYAAAPGKVYPSGPRDCRNSGDFSGFLSQFKTRAAREGVSARVIDATLTGMTLDPSVIGKDRGGQAVFSQTFLQFSDRMISRARLSRGAQLLRQYADVFQRIEQRYGVPGPVIVAFWGLETDFGNFTGDLPSIRSIATLAYDCRRPEKFGDELVAALKIVQRGDLRPSEMRGPWAGELGQTQFLPTVYFDYAVDFDGDGRRDLMRSVPDVLASTANYLKALGWKAGQPWLQEVRVAEGIDWHQADLTIQHPRSFWAKAGVTAAGGRALPADALPASLILPMGRFGPAFLAYPNFKVYLDWNHSLTYCLTAAHYAARMNGAPQLTRGEASVALSMEQVKELQRILARGGANVGDIDGKLGAGTRAAVKAAQRKHGLPADSYPTAELLRKLRGE